MTINQLAVLQQLEGRSPSFYDWLISTYMMASINYAVRNNEKVKSVDITTILNVLLYRSYRIYRKSKYRQGWEREHICEGDDFLCYFKTSKMLTPYCSHV